MDCSHVGQLVWSPCSSTYATGVWCRCEYKEYGKESNDNDDGMIVVMIIINSEDRDDLR